MSEDFVRPLSSGITDKIGAFATTVDAAENGAASMQKTITNVC